MLTIIIMFMFVCVTLLVICWFIFYLIPNYFISDNIAFSLYIIALTFRMIYYVFGFVHAKIIMNHFVDLRFILSIRIL